MLCLDKIIQHRPVCIEVTALICGFWVGKDRLLDVKIYGNKQVSNFYVLLSHNN